MSYSSCAQRHWKAVTLMGLLLLSGCQVNRPVARHRLIEHQALIDFSGLKPAEPVSLLKLNVAVPKMWEQLGPSDHILYSHVQWRAPSTHTAVGAAYIRLPLPMNADWVLLLARAQYGQSSSEGRLIAQWSDGMGRHWFEAENHRYHVQGYALVQGRNAWLVYFGYRNDRPPDMSEISLAARSADSFVPGPTR